MSHDRFLWSGPWRQLRAAFILTHPICATPGCGRPTHHVDHKLRRSAGGAPLDPANLEGYCQGCHNRKSRLHDQPRRTGDYHPHLHTANGEPTDPQHPWHRRS